MIGEFSSVGGKSSISGHCDLGEHVYIAPMSVTTNRISVGDRAYLGIGAVAIKDVPAEQIIEITNRNAKQMYRLSL